ncbi:MAG: PH domain-containing protein [Asgard group archaeon]|nr:PH domain-containing protein [Asgard group archaeon]
MGIREKIFKPHRRLIHKKNFFAFFLTIIGAAFVIIGIFQEASVDLLLNFWYVFVAITGGGYLIWVIYNILLFQTIIYVLKEDEIVTKRGVLHKKERSIPYKNVTNMSIARDPLDMLFGIGTIRIQTAGDEGEKSQEGTIEGLTNYLIMYNQLMQKTRIDEPVEEEDYYLRKLAIKKAILREFREIKELFKEKHNI